MMSLCSAPLFRQALVVALSALVLESFWEIAIAVTAPAVAKTTIRIAGRYFFMTPSIYT
jgi:hypothetical protein